MRILFISPLDPEKPGNLKFLMGGENTYTRTLLKTPPKGVSYVHFEEALKKGFIKYHPLQFIFDLLYKFRIIPPDAGIKWFVLKERFGLIHSHAYGLKITGGDVAVILSDSSSNFLFLRDYLQWGSLRLKIFLGIKKFLVRTFKIYDSNFNLMNAHLIVWSEFAKKVHINLGINPKSIEVVSPGLAIAKSYKLQVTSDKLRFNILFIGTWFKRKGGPIVVQAYKRLKKKHPYLRLMVVGEVPKDFKLPKDVWHTDYLPREDLMKKVYTQADCLVLVPEKAEGFGLVILEAASFGIPAIVSDVWALPEIVENKVTGYVVKPGSVSEVVRAIDMMIINPESKERMGQKVLERFKQKYYVGETNKELKMLYQKTITDFKTREFSQQNEQMF